MLYFRDISLIPTNPKYVQGLEQSK